MDHKATRENVKTRSRINPSPLVQWQPTIRPPLTRVYPATVPFARAQYRDKIIDGDILGMCNVGGGVIWFSMRSLGGEKNIFMFENGVYIAYTYWTREYNAQFLRWTILRSGLLSITENHKITVRKHISRKIFQQESQDLSVSEGGNRNNDVVGREFYHDCDKRLMIYSLRKNNVGSLVVHQTIMVQMITMVGWFQSKWTACFERE